MSTTIAQTILTQLGGNRFLAMAGAKQLVDLGNGLQFAIGRGASNKANKVVITLDGDLYAVRFVTIRGATITERGTFDTHF